MCLEICCCNMHRYLQKMKGDRKIEGHMLLENSTWVLILRHKVECKQREIYKHTFFSRFTVTNHKSLTHSLPCFISLLYHSHSVLFHGSALLYEDIFLNIY